MKMNLEISTTTPITELLKRISSLLDRLVVDGNRKRQKCLIIFVSTGGSFNIVTCIT